jgi:hypothetical protein
MLVMMSVNELLGSLSNPDQSMYKRGQSIEVFKYPILRVTLNFIHHSAYILV